VAHERQPARGLAIKIAAPFTVAEVREIFAPEPLC
jgi:hypothetical protein